MNIKGFSRKISKKMGGYQDFRDFRGIDRKKSFTLDNEKGTGEFLSLQWRTYCYSSLRA